MYIPPLLLVLRDPSEEGVQRRGESEVVRWLHGHSRTDALQTHKRLWAAAQSLSRLEPDKIPAWTTGNARRVSALVKKLFKTGNSMERKFVLQCPTLGSRSTASRAGPVVKHSQPTQMDSMLYFILFYFMKKKRIWRWGCREAGKDLEGVMGQEKIWSKYNKLSKNKLKHYH